MSEDGQLIPDPEGQDAPEHALAAGTHVPEPKLPGKRLREEREARGISIGEVAHALKFSVRQLEALEADDYSSLQGSTFQRGFIRSYARYLKLDAAPLLALLDVAAPPVEAEIVAPSNMGTAVSQPFIERNQKWVLLGLTLVTVAAIGAYLLTKEQGGGASAAKTEPEQQQAATQPASQPEIQPTVVAPTPVPLSSTPASGSEAPATQQPSAPANAPAPAAPASAPAAPAPAPSSAAPGPATPAATGPASQAPTASAPTQPAGQKQLVLDFDGRSWVEIKDASQKVIFTGEYGAGTHQVINGKPPFQLWIGKASAVRVNYNEQKVNLQPHARDEVARLTLE